MKKTKNKNKPSQAQIDFDQMIRDMIEYNGFRMDDEPNTFLRLSVFSNNSPSNWIKISSDNRVICQPPGEPFAEIPIESLTICVTEYRFNRVSDGDSYGILPLRNESFSYSTGWSKESIFAKYPTIELFYKLMVRLNNFRKYNAALAAEKEESNGSNDL